MADKTINELVEATQILQQDLFVLQQENTAKKISGQTLVTYLLHMIDGHGGVSSYGKVSTSGLVDTYRFTFADESTLDIPVTNGRAITSVKQTSVNGLTCTYTIAFNDNTSQVFTVADGRSIQSVQKTGTSGLVDTYTISFNDGSKETFTVTNGAKGDKGDNTYTHFKFASQEPTDTSHSMGDIPDNWIGMYWGPLENAPTDWKQYQWFKIKGEQGDTGDPATLASSSVEYQVSDSGTIIPSGSWSTSIPVVAQGRYLWTRTTNTFNTGNPVVSYSVSRMGMDGSGSVSSVADISPDKNGNVPLTAADVGALPSTGGDLTGELRMNGQPISGLNTPAADDQAATKGYVDTAKEAAKAYTNAQVKKATPRNLLDNSDFRNPVNQRGEGITSTQYKRPIDRWQFDNNGKTGHSCGYDSTNRYMKLDATGATAGFCALYHSIEGKGVEPGDYTVAFHAVDFSAGQKCQLIVLGDGATIKMDGNLIPDDNGLFYMHFTVPNKLSSTLFFGVYALPGRFLFLDWAACYPGTYTAENMPEYQPKGYGAELRECRRYFRTLEGYLLGTRGYSNKKHIQVPIDNDMRIIPTPSIIGTPYGACVGIDGVGIGYNGVTAVSKDWFVLTIDADIEKPGPVAVYLNNEIILSADL